MEDKYIFLSIDYMKQCGKKRGQANIFGSEIGIKNLGGQKKMGKIRQQGTSG